ncbi:hypothetical protein EJ02DRAFT_442831 [Clathrospora elynae]|uniref:Rhodopsin domain-containing protein n=1 Tax=Clathrospora elynae TaxID=706981 RepID=A0A6A5SW97_9PLEO|nr:hypothetical protein EJ02DRAFT_442831 [Clathrospora elynae]
MSVLQPEAGIFYGVCWIVVIIRLISRRLHRGSWKLLQLDDYLILVAMATDTVLIVVMNKIVKTSSNLIPPGDNVSSYSEAEIQSRIYGSKLVLVVEQMQLLTIWLIKACLLIMYNRMTLVLPQHKIVVCTAIYVGVAFVVMEVLYLGVWCRPFSQYWAVPPNSSQCSAATNHLITNAIFNISSDLIILSIPLPLLFKVRLPKKNKAILFAIFLIGAFTIVAAALNKYYSFTHPFGNEWTIWYLRESYTAILCANLPLTYPLIQRIFGLRNWNSHTYTDNGRYGSTTLPQRSTHTNWPEPRAPHIPRGFRDTFRRTESQEDINGGLGKQREEQNDPQFITSAIEMESNKSHRASNPDSSTTRRSVEEGSEHL